MVSSLYLSLRKRLGRQEEAFDLGRFEVPVAVAALVWSIAALFVLFVPSEAEVPVVIVGGVIVTGAVFSLGLLMFNREAFETEPGEVSIPAPR